MTVRCTEVSVPNKAGRPSLLGTGRNPAQVGTALGPGAELSPGGLSYCDLEDHDLHGRAWGW
jgi:hypothetical protein